MVDDERQAALPFNLDLEAGKAGLRRDDPVVRGKAARIIIGLARKKNPDALIALGDDLVEDSPRKARNHYLKAAELGSTTAMVRLGAQYETAGQNDKARTWFRLAAEQGDADGRQWLSEPARAARRRSRRDAGLTRSSPGRG